MEYDDDLHHLFDTHLSALSLYDEICTLQVKLASLKQQNEETKSSISPVIPEFLLDLLNESRWSKEAATPEHCIEQLVQLSQCEQYGDGAKSAADASYCLLSTEQQSKLEVTKSLLKSIKARQAVRWPEVVEQLCKLSLPIEVMWGLHTDNILHLSVFIERAAQDKRKCVVVLEQLLCLCCGDSQTVATRRQILSDVSCQLLKMAFPEKKTEDSSLKKACLGILDGVTRGILDSHLSTPALLLHTEVLSSGAAVPAGCFKKFCTHTIVLVMGHHADMKVSEALKQQAKWKSSKIEDNLKTLYKNLLCAFESREVVEILHRILEKHEVNWQMLLSFLAIFLVTFPGASKDVQSHIAKLLSEGLENGDMENAIIAFLLTRQSCAEGAHVFSGYSQWFQETFSDSSRTPASSKKPFTFLVKFLTDLVPFEPADILKVHILRPPFIPPKCRDQWMDYILLAKTRLADLKVPIEETNSSIYSSDQNPGSSSSQCNPAVQDVEKAVASFHSAGKLPTTIMEASIFRKPYFVGKFLSALLQPRHLPDVPDGKMKFIEALKRAGKIPSSLFATYEEACRQETRQLLEGVFEVDDDDDEVDEMMLGPLEQLQHRLKKLKDMVCSGTTETKVSEMISVISEKIECVTGPLPTSGDTVGGQCTIVLCSPSLNPLQVQVIGEVLNCVCQTRSKAADAWLHELVRMLSQHLPLLPALFVHIHTLLTHKATSLYEHHIEGLAALVFHIHNNWILFPSVVFQMHDFGEKSTSFLMTLLDLLPVSTSIEMIFTRRFLACYLKTSFMWQNYHKADFCGLEAAIPRQLVVIFAVISMRLNPNAAWTNQEADEQLPSETIERGEQSYQESVACALYTSETFQGLLKDNRPCLDDWLDMELKVSPFADCISPLQRQNHQLSMISHYCLAAEGKADNSSGDAVPLAQGLMRACSVIMNKVAQALSRCHIETAGRCPRCQRPTKVSQSGKGGQSSEAALTLLSVLSKLLINMPNHHENIGRLWMVEEVFNIMQPSSPTTEVPTSEAVLRVILQCPAHLLFTNSLSNGASVELIKDTIKFVEDFLVKHNGSEILPLDVTLHLLQGYFAVADKAGCVALQKFEQHPYVILSLLVHWSSLTVLLPSLTSASSPWRQTTALFQAAGRDLDGEQSTSLLAAADPFTAAAAVYAVLHDRCWQCQEERRKGFISSTFKACPEVISSFSKLLEVAAAYGLSSSDQTTLAKCQKQLAWLADILLINTWWIKDAADQVSSSASPCFAAVNPPSLLPFRELAILRCACLLPAARVAEDRGVTSSLVSLFARLCRRFQDVQPLAKSADLNDVLQLSQAILSLVKATPVSLLQQLNMDEVKECGLEIYRVFQQRLNSIK